MNTHIPRLRSLTTLALTAASILFVAAGSATAEPARVAALDPEATTVDFFVEATGHDVAGRFALDSGRLTIEPSADEAGGRATGELVIDARRADSGNRRRDRQMHGDVLHSEEYPHIRFSVERYTGAFPGSGSGHLVLIGQMELVGQPHPMEIPVDFTLDGDHFTAETSFDVPYVAWGLERPGFLFFKVAETVRIDIAAQGELSTSAVSDVAATATAAGGVER